MRGPGGANQVSQLTWRIVCCTAQHNAAERSTAQGSTAQHAADQQGGTQRALPGSRDGEALKGSGNHYQGIQESGNLRIRESGNLVPRCRRSVEPIFPPELRRREPAELALAGEGGAWYRRAPLHLSFYSSIIISFISMKYTLTQTLVQASKRGPHRLSLEQLCSEHVLGAAVGRAACALAGEAA